MQGSSILGRGLSFRPIGMQVCGLRRRIYSPRSVVACVTKQNRHMQLQATSDNREAKIRRRSTNSPVRQGGAIDGPLEPTLSSYQDNMTNMRSHLERLRMSRRTIRQNRRLLRGRRRQIWRNPEGRESLQGHARDAATPTARNQLSGRSGIQVAGDGEPFT